MCLCFNAFQHSFKWAWVQFSGRPIHISFDFNIGTSYLLYDVREKVRFNFICNSIIAPYSEIFEIIVFGQWLRMINWTTNLIQSFSILSIMTTSVRNSKYVYLLSFFGKLLLFDIVLKRASVDGKWFYLVNMCIAFVNTSSVQRLYCINRIRTVHFLLFWKWKNVSFYFRSQIWDERKGIRNCLKLNYHFKSFLFQWVIKLVFQFKNKYEIAFPSVKPLK